LSSTRNRTPSQILVNGDFWLIEDPQDWTARYNRGYAYHNLGQYERAIQHYSEAILMARSDEMAGMVHNRRGITYQHLGITEESENDFEKAKKLGFDAETDPHNHIFD
tara:strand:+ start:1341 stop:1664 length:324 start_codon:yes stop_codon:yes gene_type:complete